jgi:soluble lytic murein transglycosylase-like protein
MNRGFRVAGTAAVIDGTQGVETGRSLRDQAIGSSHFGSSQQVSEEVPGQIRHVTSDNQVPIRLGHAQGSEDSAKRATTLYMVGNHGIAQRSVPLRRANQGDLTRSFENPRGDALNQCRPVQRQKSLVPAHTGTSAANEHKPGSHPVPFTHEMIITYVRRGHNAIVRANKKMYICSLVAFAMLAASPMPAAEVTSALPEQKPPERKTLVVRADSHTGRLVQSAVVSTRTLTRPATTARDISEIVERSSRAHDVDPLLVHSMIKVESNYDPNAVSSKGAEGLMQLMPPTARMLGVSDSFDPQQNIEAGVKYLSYLKSLYKDDRLALAAYNAGPGAVDKYKWIPPYRETQNYVDQVGKRYGDARRAAAKPAAPAAVKAAEPVVEAPVAQVMEDQHPKLEQFVDTNGRLHLRTTQ